jgi:hypothetical protein
MKWSAEEVKWKGWGAKILHPSFPALFKRNDDYAILLRGTLWVRSELGGHQESGLQW